MLTPVKKRPPVSYPRIGLDWLARPGHTTPLHFCRTLPPPPSKIEGGESTYCITNGHLVESLVTKVVLTLLNRQEVPTSEFRVSGV